MEGTITKQLDILKQLNRPNSKTYINNIFDDFIVLSGDRFYGDDSAIIGGVASLYGMPFTVIGQLRGNCVEEQAKYNFSMAYPEGYRKSLRLMEQAEKFHRPIVCFVDTIGAFPGQQAEERGQASAISNNISRMLDLRVPIISVLIGNGGSGGALALCVADRIVALENAVFSVISPKACAEVLWKDTGKEADAVDLLKMTSIDLYEQGIIDQIIPEPIEEVYENSADTAEMIKKYIWQETCKLRDIRSSKLIKLRQKKFKKMGR